MVSAGLIPHPVVLVEGDKVLGVQTGDPPDGAEMVDLGDVTLLPGLIDAHLHLCFNASADVVGHLSDVDDDGLLGEMRVAAKRALLAGITTVRDLGDRGFTAIRLRAELAADPRAGPQVLRPARR
jgi:imidazolonepropionase-like amidohydrolase